MFARRIVAVAIFGMCVAATPRLKAADLKITLPRRSELTPVQRLNREGVEAVRKHDFAKAKEAFYQAYLYDPNDPFTLNNLGYVAELEGQVDRAEHFYALAAKQPTDAVIDTASVSRVQGESFKDELSSIHDLPMQINRGNLEAVRLLSERRAPEADLVLQRTLKLDPNNVFTINNLGVAKEMEGDFPAALQYYSQAARMHSKEPAVVSVNQSWRDKPVSEMAANSAKDLRQRMKALQSPEQQAELFNLRGVSAINRNDWQEADKDFRQAYKLDPYNAFSMNNLGYLSEMSGDMETAQFFYEKAQSAQNAGARVGLASNRAAEGLPLSKVADQSDESVGTKIDQDRLFRQREGGPIELKRRDGSIPGAAAPAQTPNPASH